MRETIGRLGLALVWVMGMVGIFGLVVAIDCHVTHVPDALAQGIMTMAFFWPAIPLLIAQLFRSLLGKS